MAGEGPSIVDLFCGPGGLSEGFRQAGFRTLVATDYDMHAAETFKYNHSDVEFVEGDITNEEVKQKILDAVSKKTQNNTVDVVIGGPPCKGFSLENKKTRTMKNPQNALVEHFADVVSMLKPKAFVMENVPGIFAMRKGKVALEIITALKALGYSNSDSWVLNAVNYGVPQLRERAIFVGSLINTVVQKPQVTHIDANQLVLEQNSRRDARVTVRDAISDLPPIPAGGGGSDELDYTKEPKTDYQALMRRDSKKIYNHITSMNSDIVIRRLRKIPEGGNWRNIPKALMKVNGWYKEIEKTHSLIYRRMRWDAPSTTLTNFRKAMLVHPSQNRLFSVREAARLQSFPDRYVFCGGLSAKQQQVSDAVPTLLAKAVATAVLQHLAQKIII